MPWEYVYVIKENGDYVMTEQDFYVITSAVLIRLKEASSVSRLKDSEVEDGIGTGLY